MVRQKRGRIAGCNDAERRIRRNERTDSRWKGGKRNTHERVQASGDGET